MKVGFYQFNPLFGEITRNLDHVSNRLSQAQCDLMVLPELFASGYQFISKQEVEELAEPVPDGPTTQRLIELARAGRMVLVAGLPERDGAQIQTERRPQGPHRRRLPLS